MIAGVGHPVGVLGRVGREVIAPFAISSESRMGVRTVFPGLGPAPDMPGTVERRVLARIMERRGFSGWNGGSGEINCISICI